MSKKAPDFHGHMNDDGTVTFTALSDAAKAAVGVDRGASDSITVDLNEALQIEGAIEAAGLVSAED